MDVSFGMSLIGWLLAGIFWGKWRSERATVQQMMFSQAYRNSFAGLNSVMRGLPFPEKQKETPLAPQAPSPKSPGGGK